MSRLIFLAFLLVCAMPLWSQNPHGASLKLDCAACHSSNGWEINAAYWQSFDPGKPTISKTTGMVWGLDTLRFHHSKTDFALTGRHATVDCRGCHENLVFSETPSDCISCHQDMHQQTVGNDCARCHTTSNWLVDNITDLHQQNGFPLTGVHQAVSCEQCHTAASGLQFNRIGNNCVDCHRQDFQATTNPNHQQAGFSTDCLECHDAFTAGWGTDKVNHDFFPLTKGHEIADCKQCHTGGNYTNTPNTCNACHQPDFDGAQSPNHVAAHFSNDCAQCHTTDPDWTPATYTAHDATYFPIYSGKHQGQWTSCTDCHLNPNSYAEYSCTVCHLNPETNDAHTSVNGYVYDNPACLACHPTGDADVAFDHNATDFPLTGAHQTTDCLACHAGGYQGTPTQCSACHTTDYQSSTNPNHVGLNLPTDCAMCHTTAPGWEPASFPIHNNFYPLNGAHAAIANDCATCHNGNYNSTPNTCNGCHAADYAQTTDPNHVVQQFSTDCTSCHSESAWSPSTFDHSTVYPFVGAHMAIANDCNACHHGNYTNTPNTCNGCHAADYAQTTDPNHTSLQFPTDCATCHSESAWSPSTFDHNTVYPFTGAHVAIADDCNACHHGNYTNTPNTCAGCHTPDYQSSTNPNHVALNLPTDCATCHTTAPGWEPATFPIHNNYYALNGAHAAIASDCATCHNGNYNNTPNTCNGCHAPDYAQTTDPNHTTLQFPTDCATCHSETAWAPSTFDHSTVYPFTGAHVAIADDCNTCHHGNYSNTPNTCNGCHTSDYNSSTNPNHVALNLPTDCAMCHTTAPGWEPATFPIHNNYYALNGAHAAIANDCATCHNGNYNTTPNTCNGCHAPDYAQTTDPNHTTQQFPTDCATCHSETAWVPSTFDHSTVYPFTGAHVAIADDCNACHHGNYTNTPNTCNGCHTADYNTSVNPNHTTLNLPTDCAMCHTTAPGWEPATFPIHNNYYALNGAHAMIANDCATCHNGNYNNTPNTCNGCHAPDYAQTTNPNHTALQFSNDCATCHTESAWAPATFDHDAQYFPIYSGKHDGEWTSCTDCHTNPSNYAEFTCITCHTNPETNNQHNGINGYTYNSSACLACHPTGSATDGFDHNNTNFPLTGAHLTTDCVACHANGYAGTPTQCSACHTPDYQSSTNPNHVALNLPTDCAMCHTTAPGWEPATFPIHNNYYALNGAHAAIANDCAVCHNGNYNTTPNTCNGCHAPDYAQTTDPNHTTQQFPTDCAMCHSETAWAPSTFDHSTVYPFTGAHIAIANDCDACHHGNYTNTPNTCNGCHAPDYSTSTNPNHVTLNLPTDCAMCHTTAPGWEPATFPIHNNYYALNGAHAAIANDCAVCHNGNYNNTPNTCNGCHAPDYAQTTDPNHTTQQFPTDCAMCHSETAWAPSTFDHNAIYPFTGAHIAIADDCAACHHGNYTNTPNTCNGCHAPDYNTSTNPNHVTLNLPTDCAMCHTTAPGWEPATFPIHNNYYALNGAHAAIANDCAVCHNGNYNNTPNTCNGCHAPDYAQTTDPNHTTQQFPTDCALCHTESAWVPSTFDHNAIYPFTGAHIAIADDCAACHHGNYTNTPNTCNGCHTPDYNTTTNPNHVTLNLPTDCAMCHTTDPGWEPATFPIHNNYYALNGAHAAIANDCAACHNGNYNNTPNTCNGCHAPDYAQTTDPNHTAQQFPTDCALCHTESAWVPSTFDHNAIYPFTGAHIAIADDCAACHHGNYTNTPNTCNGCHTPDYNTSTNPNHVTLNLPTDCAMCHTTDPGWEPATFPIHNNYWALNGAHATIANDCAACHNGNYNNTPNTCNGCHAADYAQTNDPNHTTQQFPTDCTICHSESAWVPSTFDHNTVYPFTGAHIAIADDCNACHNGNYTNTPNTCNGCHMTDFNTSTNPNHVSLNLPTDCAMCHTTDPGWEPATFPIHNSFWALNGAHAAIANDCAACHNGNYNNTPNTCYGCHAADYNGANSPNHQSAGFPTTCQNCHTETAWVPSTWDHDDQYFPIFSGRHKNEWDQCVDCHTVPNNFALFSCIDCHEHDNPANMADHHQGVSGYQYVSTACYACHPDGNN